MKGIHLNFKLSIISSCSQDPMHAKRTEHTPYMYAYMVQVCIHTEYVTYGL